MTNKLRILSGFIFLSLVHYSFGQNNEDILNSDIKNKDSIAYEKGITIVRALFDGNDEVVQERTNCNIFYWCTLCEGKIGCCEKFVDTYKKHLTPDLAEKLDGAEFDRKMESFITDKTSIDSNSVEKVLGEEIINTMVFHWSFLDGTGETWHYYFEFHKPQDVGVVMDDWTLVSVCQTPGCTNQFFESK